MDVRNVAALVVLALSPVWTGCYNTTATSKGIQEDVQRREVSPLPPRVDVAASRSADGSVEISAAEKRLCRTKVFGTATPYTEAQEVRDPSVRRTAKRSAIIGLLAGAGGVVLATPEKAVDETDAEYKDRKAWGTGVAAFGGAFLLVALASSLAPERRTTRSFGDPQPLERDDGEPFVCEGTSPVPVPSVPVLARFTFDAGKLDMRATTGADGRARLDATPVALTAGHCGKATLDASIGEGARLPQGIAAGLGGKLELEFPPGSLVPLGVLAEKDPAAAVVASLCCTRRAVESSGDECEERCARAGMVQRCLFNRRACLLKTERAEDEPEKARALCRSFYEECLVGNGTSSRNLAQCIDGCGAQRATEICR